MTQLPLFYIELWLDLLKHHFLSGMFFAGIGSFFVIFLGSVAVGVIVALLSALLFKFTELSKYPTLETVLLVLYAYASYLLAEGLGLSNIVAILFCGIVMAHYSFNNLSVASQELSSSLFEVVALITETLVFAYLGLALFSFDNEYDFGFIFFAIVIILVARAAHVFPLSFLINLARRPERKINRRHQVFIWFAGLRGAIAFALALDVPKALGGATAIFTTTLMIIFFTVLVEGGVTITLLQKLNIPMNVDQDVSSSEMIDRPKESNLFLDFDRKYLKTFFTKNNTHGAYHLQNDEFSQMANTVELTSMTESIDVPANGVQSLNESDEE